MASSTSPDKNENPDGSQDLISSMPDIVTEKILKRLPIKIAAQTSVLSRKWRLNWLSLQHLVFDTDFLGWCKSGRFLERSSIISNTLLHHKGQIHEFCCLPEGTNISQWLAFLSRANLKKFTLINGSQLIMPSHIYYCKELRKLKLHNCILNPPPFEFTGFSDLRSIEFVYVKLKGDFLCSLIKHSPKLVVLKLHYCSGSIDDLVVEAPCLTNISLSLKEDSVISSNTIAALITSLASSSLDLQTLELCGVVCKILGGGRMTELIPLAFNKLERLHLEYLDLGDANVVRCAFAIIQICPSIQDLEISNLHQIRPVKRTKKFKLEYDKADDYKLCNLRAVKLMGIGVSAELILIEYLLAISTVLEKLFYDYRCIGPDTEAEPLLRKLLQFSRASSKAKVYLPEE